MKKAMTIFKNIQFIDPDTFEITTRDLKCYDRSALTEDVIDASALYAIRSFVNGHHHVYSALARGMHAPRKSPSNFSETLEYIWWTLDQCLDADMIRISALVTAMACAKNGCTFVIDHHASPSHLKGSLEIIARAFDEVGIGHLLAYEITDRYGVSRATEALEETAEYLKTRKGLVGLHASFTVGNETLNKCVNLATATGTGFHIHVAEDPVDQEITLAEYGCSVVKRLQNHGVFDLQGNIFAHCLHLDEEERKIIADSKTTVVVNADSNLNNKVGYFSSRGLGDRIMLGTDGMHSDMIKSAQTAFFSGQNHDKQASIPAIYHRLRHAHTYLKEIGISDDESFVIFDYDSPTPITSGNFAGHFFFGLENRHIKYTVSDGELIYKNGLITRVDEKAILAESRILAGNLWNKMDKF